MLIRLTQARFQQGLTELIHADADLARVVSQYGAPPMWQRPAGFEGLLRIILEQQVSLAAAKAVFARLQQLVTSLTAENISTLSDAELKSIGFSRQKLHYCRCLSTAVIEGTLPLHRLSRMPDEKVRAALTQVKGIGNWSADIYLLMAMRRPDIWPNGDLALDNAVCRLKRLRKPTPMRLTAIAAKWRPWRSVAAHIAWHYYLSAPKKRVST